MSETGGGDQEAQTTSYKINITGKECHSMRIQSVKL